MTIDELKKKAEAEGFVTWQGGMGHSLWIGEREGATMYEVKHFTLAQTGGRPVLRFDDPSVPTVIYDLLPPMTWNEVCSLKVEPSAKLSD
tara:strand:- start:96 stop:365 length:270 start_codon:yes stop_codon:yes gene_type:complete